MAYSLFDVQSQRGEDPVQPPAIDRQRKYMATGPAAGQGAVNRRKAQTASVNSSRPNGFKVRQRTKKHY